MIDFIAVQSEDFCVNEQQDLLHANNTDIGGTCHFVGTVRGGDCNALELEHYPGMTEKSLQDIVASASQRWSLHSVRVIHRIGKLMPGEKIVYVGVASRHRQAAFDACAYIMDYLKTQAPFWKKEYADAGEQWVDARDTDTQALQRWQ